MKERNAMEKSLEVVRPELRKKLQLTEHAEALILFNSFTRPPKSVGLIDGIESVTNGGDE